VGGAGSVRAWSPVIATAACRSNCWPARTRRTPECGGTRPPRRRLRPGRPARRRWLVGAEGARLVFRRRARGWRGCRACQRQGPRAAAGSSDGTLTSGLRGVSRRASASTRAALAAAAPADPLPPRRSPMAGRPAWRCRAEARCSSGTGCVPQVRVWGWLAQAPDFGIFEFISGNWRFAEEATSIAAALRNSAAPSMSPWGWRDPTTRSSVGGAFWISGRQSRCAGREATLPLAWWSRRPRSTPDRQRPGRSSGRRECAGLSSQPSRAGAGQALAPLPHPRRPRRSGCGRARGAWRCGARTDRRTQP
jgi:hypothetical protein